MGKHGYSRLVMAIQGPNGVFKQEIGIRDDLLPETDTPRAVAGRESSAQRVVTTFAELYRQAHEAPPAAPSQG